MDFHRRRKKPTDCLRANWPRPLFIAYTAHSESLRLFLSFFFLLPAVPAEEEEIQCVFNYNSFSSVARQQQQDSSEV